MILVLVIALYGLSLCAGDGYQSGAYGDYGDILDKLKNIGDGKYIQQAYTDKFDDKKDNKKYLDYKEYDDQKDGYAKNDNDDKARYGGKGNDVRDRSDMKDDIRVEYNYETPEKYDGPQDFIVTDKDDRSFSGRNYGKLGSDLNEYDYVPKCDYSIKDCKDGRDCYDKAKDRSAYDTCRDTYGLEDRYYDEQDRYNTDRYRYDSENERFGYEKDCYDNSKGRAEYEKCRRYYKKCSQSRNDYKYSYNEDDWKNDFDCYDNNLVGIGRNDREDQLIRPCALDDWQCIRKYFAENSKCKPAFGPIPDPLYLKRNTVYLPYANITLIITRLRVTGLSSFKISEFYVNKDTKNLVIAFDFQKMNQTAPRTYFRYKRTAKESIVLSDYGTIEYNSGTFTAVIPRVPNLRLDLAEIHADIDDLLPRYFIGPKAVASLDPDVISGFARLNSNLPVGTQEYFLLQSQLFTAIYIQENICDFGLKLISI